MAHNKSNHVLTFLGCVPDLRELSDPLAAHCFSFSFAAISALTLNVRNIGSYGERCWDLMVNSDIHHVIIF